MKHVDTIIINPQPGKMYTVSAGADGLTVEIAEIREASPAQELTLEDDEEISWGE